MTASTLVSGTRSRMILCSVLLVFLQCLLWFGCSRAKYLPGNKQHQVVRFQTQMRSLESWKMTQKLSLQTVGSFQRHGQLRTCIQHTRRLFHRTIAALRTRSPELNCLPPPSSETRPAISSWCNVARLKLSTFECIWWCCTSQYLKILRAFRQRAWTSKYGHQSMQLDKNTSKI